jgi:hypothetical protein
MGSNSSKNNQDACLAEYGDLFLDLSKESYSPGDIVTGNVYLYLNKAYPANQLTIKFKGTEFVYFADIQRKPVEYLSPSEMIHRTHHETTVKLKIPLFSWGNTQEIPVGQYIFPFSFQLPLNIPGTFFQKRWCLLGDISYSLSAFLDTAENKKKKKKKNKQPRLMFNCDVTIKEAVPNQPLKKIEQSANIPMSCLCFQKGNSLISAEFEKNAYNPGDTATVILDINNHNSPYDLKRITLSFRQVVTLMHPKSGVTRMFKLSEQYVDGVKAGSASEIRMIEIKLPPAEVPERELLKEKNLSVKLFDEGEDFLFSNPSTRGKMIISCHSLNVLLEFSGFMGTTITHEINVPVTIHAESLKPNFDVTAPEGWHPQQMNTNNNISEFKSVYMNEGLAASPAFGIPKTGDNHMGNANGKRFQKEQVDDDREILNDSKIDDVEKAVRLESMIPMHGDLEGGVQMQMSEPKNVRIDFEKGH